jgi:class 3 adenylate cyclase
VGIHCGEVEVRGANIAGLAVHLAARVEASADSGETWATSTVRESMIGSDAQFTLRGDHDLKGIPGRWTLYSVRV